MNYWDRVLPFVPVLVLVRVFGFSLSWKDESQGNDEDDLQTEVFQSPHEPPPFFAILSFISLRTRAGGRGLFAGNRIVPLLVS